LFFRPSYKSSSERSWSNISRIERPIEPAVKRNNRLVIAFLGCPQYETFLPVSIFYQTITGTDVEMDIETDIDSIRNIR